MLNCHPRRDPGSPHDLDAWLPARQAPWEPEMGANVFSRLQTQRDVARFFSQVRGSLFDSVRR